MKIFSLKRVRMAWMTLAVLLVSAGAGWAQEFPKPGPEHEWLQRFVGEWEGEMNVYMEPGKEPMKAKGKETVRSTGGFWIVSEMQNNFMDMPMTGVMTLGYDPDKKKYVGTWVDSSNSHMWQYEGTVDASGKTLTLETEGPCPMKPGKMFKFKEMVELQNPDSKLYTSTMQDENGQWVTIMSGTSHRMK